MADNKKIENSKIDALYQWVSYDLQKVKEDLLNELKMSSAQVGYLYKGIKEDKESAAIALENEIRYSYKQNQNIYEGLNVLVKTQVAERLNAMDEKMSGLEQLQATLSEINELKYNCSQLQAIYETLANIVVGELTPKVDGIPTKEDVKEFLDESVSVHTQKVADAVTDICIEPVDYTRISEEVGDKVLDLLNQLSGGEAGAKVDYEKMAGDTAAKVVESLPYQEPVDYNRIEEMIAKAVNVDAIADAVVAKMGAPAVDYDKLADTVLDKLAERGMSADVVLDDEGITKIADTVGSKIATSDGVDYDRVAAIIEEKLANISLVCEYVPAEEEIAEEAVAEAEPIETVVAEAVEEVIVEEAVEEIVEGVEEAPVEVASVSSEKEDELAIAALVGFQEDGDGQLIDAETGLVIRLKRSFTAKMKQSEERIKVYYSDIKNALTSYKRINSNVSWHGDRFNYGRDTVAKIGVNGKTLCFYLALDPNDPELKTTVYHQKDVGNQKAYENTPFLVKVKSDAAAKKALRLVGVLAEKLGAEQDESFEEVDYVAEFAYASTKRLFEDGDIKATKEKKVDFDF